MARSTLMLFVVKVNGGYRIFPFEIDHFGSLCASHGQARLDGIDGQDLPRSSQAEALAIAN